MVYKTFVFVMMLTLPCTHSAAQNLAARRSLNRGNELVAQGKYPQAIQEYATIEASAGEIYARSLYNIGVCYYELFQTEQAIAYYQKAVAVSNFRYAQASYALGIALQDLAKTAEAKRAYLEATNATREGFGPALFKLGVISASEGDLKTATRFFRRAAQLRGEHSAATHNNLGVMLARLGKLSEAEREFEVALDQTDGSFEDARRNLRLCRVMLRTAQASLNTDLELELTTRFVDRRDSDGYQTR